MRTGRGENDVRMLAMPFPPFVNRAARHVKVHLFISRNLESRGGVMCRPGGGEEARSGKGVHVTAMYDWIYTGWHRYFHVRCFGMKGMLDSGGVYIYVIR